MVTGILAVKNAILRGLLHGIGRLKLGAKVLRIVFDQLGVTDDSSQGERAGVIGRTVERIPLRVAEDRLRSAVHGLLQQRAAQTGLRAWFARNLMNATLERVEALTLSRFRADDAKLEGVDLRVVRDELGDGIDAAIGNQVVAHLNRLNLLIAGLYVILSGLVAYGVSRISV